VPWPIAHGPDIHGIYQQITGEPMPEWPLFSHKISEGANSGDKGFPTRWPWMREQGFKYRGAYHWLRSDSRVSDQVANVIRRLDPHGGLLIGEFIQSDWETTPGIHLIGAEGEREFCDRLHQHYQRECTITYSSDWIPDSPEDSDTLGEFYNWLNLTQGNAPLWYANYNSDLTNPRGGWQETTKYGADIWQFTSSYFHPSIISVSGGGFDMNHILNWDTLDRIAGYQNEEIPPEEEDMGMKSILYTVKSAGGDGWFLVSPEHRVRTFGAQAEHIDWPTAGALERSVDIAVFLDMLPHLQPVGDLNAPTEALLGITAAADWKARTSSSSGNQWGMTGTVDLNSQTIDLNPK